MSDRQPSAGRMEHRLFEGMIENFQEGLTARDVCDDVCVSDEWATSRAIGRYGKSAHTVGSGDVARRVSTAAGVISNGTSPTVTFPNLHSAGNLIATRRPAASLTILQDEFGDRYGNISVLFRSPG